MSEKISLDSSANLYEDVLHDVLCSNIRFNNKCNIFFESRLVSRKQNSERFVISGR